MRPAVNNDVFASMPLFCQLCNLLNFLRKRMISYIMHSNIFVSMGCDMLFKIFWIKGDNP